MTSNIEIHRCRWETVPASHTLQDIRVLSNTLMNPATKNQGFWTSLYASSSGLRHPWPFDWQFSVVSVSDRFFSSAKRSVVRLHPWSLKIVSIPFKLFLEIKILILQQ